MGMRMMGRGHATHSGAATRRKTSFTVLVLPMLALWVAGLAGCAQPWHQLEEQPYPGDFALVLTVYTDGHTDEADPMQAPAQYVLLADRQLRVAVGRDAAHDYFPQVTARLDPDTMERLYRLVDEGTLLEPGDREMVPDAARSASVWYELSVTSDFRTVRYMTVPDRAPEAEALLAELVELSGRGAE